MYLTDLFDQGVKDNSLFWLSNNLVYRYFKFPTGFSAQESAVWMDSYQSKFLYLSTRRALHSSAAVIPPSEAMPTEAVTAVQTGG